MLQPPAILLDACKKGDRLAQSTLYKMCYPILMRIGWRYETESGMAPEYVNMAFFKIIQNLSSYAESVPFEAWIRRIMINCVIDEFRKNKKYKEMFVRPETESPPENTSDLISLNEFEQQWQAEDIHRLLSTLPEATAKVFNLFVFDEYTHKEIAIMLGISEGTSKWHVASARQTLKQKLTQRITQSQITVNNENVQ